VTETTESAETWDVPRSIHQLWIGDPPPDWIKACMETVRELHPSWEYELWTERHLAELPMQHRDIYDHADRYVLPGRVHQFRSDLARYEILLQFGGVWIDTDIEMLRPLDELPTLNQRSQELLGGPVVERPYGTWFCWESQDQWVSNAIIGHRVHRGGFLELFNAGLGRHILEVRQKAGLTTASRLTGPRHLTRQLEQWPTRAGWPVGMYDQERFFPYGWAEANAGSVPPRDQLRGAGRAFGIHHWGNQRRINDRPLNLADIGGAR
jgi:hypothetical protein